ncbi:hypothetical protein C5S35_02520 [Candidatus Methanophagaceae archaeon]|nr:hypothetical protein C5S35_02520 [Methanophagales archaeon]
MRVANKRWGEVTIKKQGEEKNKFDKTKSFSIIKSKNEYTLEQLKEIFEMVINLTDNYTFEELRRTLKNLKGRE